MRPSGGVLFDVAEELIHRHRHHTDQHQAGKGQRQALLAAGCLHQGTNAGIARRHFCEHSAHKSQGDRHFERSIEIRHAARQANFGENVPALGAEHPQHIFQLRLQCGQARGDVDRDREKADQKGGQDAGTNTDAKPHHQNRHNRGLGDRIETHHQGIKRRIGHGRGAHHETEQNTHRNRNAEAYHRDPEGLPSCFEQRLLEFKEFLGNLQRTGENEFSNVEQRNNRLPQQQHHNQHDNRCEALKVFGHHGFSPVY